ncbi:MAG TPA: hypothetical protein DC054_09985 [Blastocatellia bacterium]|nr:hypothetical protein [Blastocatellia bacterium]
MTMEERRRRIALRKKDAGNLLALVCIQASNAGLPLLVYPYVLHVVGAKHYAEIALAEATMSTIAGTIVLYGFDVEGVTRVAGLDVENDRTFISRVFSEIFVSRAVLFFCLILPLLTATVLLSSQPPTILLGWMLIPLSFVFQPTWLFQGLETNVPLAICTVASRLPAVPLIIALVRSPSDYQRMPLIIGGLYLTGGIASFCYCLWVLGLRMSWVPARRVTELLASGKEIFFGNASVVLYRDMNVILIKLVGGTGIEIASYSIAEKVVKSIQAVMRPLNQLYFPRAIKATRNMSSPNRQALKIIFRLTWPQLLSLAAIAIFLGFSFIVFWERIPAFRNVPNIWSIGVLVSLMIVSVFFGITNFMLGTAGLNHLNERFYYFKSIFAAGVFSVLLCLLLVSLYGQVGAAITFVAAEGFLTVLVVRKYIHFKGVRGLVEGAQKTPSSF